MSTQLETTLHPEGEGLEQRAESLYEERSAQRMDRRRLLTNLSLAAGAAGMVGMAGCSSAGPAPVEGGVTSASPLDVLQFALNLEYLEASFYSYVVTGSGLSAANMGSGAGTVTGGAKVNFTNPYVATLAANLMAEEVQHVAFLRATIQAAFGVSPVPMPNIDLAPVPSGASTSPYAVTNDTSFLAVARAVEGLGVSAYAGGAQYLVSSIPALNYAAQILDVEAQHSGALRQACIWYPGDTGTSAIASPAIDPLDMPPTSSQLFNTSNTTGLNPIRTISQVLAFVYSASPLVSTTPAAGISSGGWFPNGMNGNINHT